MDNGRCAVAESRAPLAPGQGGRGMQCRVLLLLLLLLDLAAPGSLLSLSVCACLFPLVSIQSTPILLQSRSQLRQAWPVYAGCT